MSAATITAEHLSLVLAAARLRRHTRGSTCQFCALSAGPMLELHCSTRLGEDYRASALRLRYAGARVTPLLRGGMAQLFERTHRQRGGAEVRRTWGAGIKALRAEPRFIFSTTGATA